jgi:2-methylcitrate dehydratase PrpD
MTDTIEAAEMSASARAADHSTRRLARMVTETRFEDLPESVVAATRRLLLDEIAVAAAAYDTPMARALYRLRGDCGGVGEATLLVDGRKVPTANAAYIHAQLANLLDADETMHNRMHTVSASVMAGLAVAELTKASGRELLTSIATGYEITARVGTSLSQWVPDGKGGLRAPELYGWSWMTLGAAATAGRLLGLDSTGLARSLGQAFITTPVYFDVERNTSRLRTEDKPGSWHKYQMSGAMSSAGIEAARLVSYGWQAQDDILDEGSGFWRSFGSAGADFDVLYSQIGERWRITETSLKPYPFCRFGHGALDLMTDLVTKHDLRAADIARIDLRIPPHSLSKKLASTVHPKESLGLMISLPSALALIAMGVPPGPKWFSRDFTDPELREMAERVHYEINDSWGPYLAEQLEQEGYFGRIPTELVLRTTAGQEHRGYTEYALGDPWSPEFSFTDKQVADKTRGFLDGILPTAKIEQLIEAVLTIEQADDVSAIAAAMTA